MIERVFFCLGRYGVQCGAGWRGAWSAGAARRGTAENTAVRLVKKGKERRDVGGLLHGIEMRRSLRGDGKRTWALKIG